MQMAVMLARMPDLWRQLLVDHVADPVGRCRDCRSGGAAAEWPCELYRVAAEARRVYEGDLPGDHRPTSAGRRWAHPRVAEDHPTAEWSRPSWL